MYSFRERNGKRVHWYKEVHVFSTKRRRRQKDEDKVVGSRWLLRESPLDLSLSWKRRHRQWYGFIICCSNPENFASLNSVWMCLSLSRWLCYMLCRLCRLLVCHVNGGWPTSWCFLEKKIRRWRERILIGGCLDLVMVDSLVRLRINRDALLIVA